MWLRISKIILRNRVIFLTGWVALTAFMTYQTLQVRLSYDLNMSIPDEAPTAVAYEAFKAEFGDEGNLIVIGVDTDSVFDLSFFQAWRELGEDLAGIENVQSVLSAPQALELVKNNTQRKFNISPVFEPALTGGPGQPARAVLRPSLLQGPFVQRGP